MCLCAVGLNAGAEFFAEDTDFLQFLVFYKKTLLNNAKEREINKPRHYAYSFSMITTIFFVKYYPIFALKDSRSDQKIINPTGRVYLFLFPKFNPLYKIQ